MKKLLLLPLLLLMAMSAGAQCTASFTAVQTPQASNLLRYIFTNTSSYGTLVNKQYVTTHFTFGDGTDNFGPLSATHNYAATGSYTVGMRMRKFDSSHNLICTDSATQTITVAYPPCGSTFTITGNPANATRTFTASTPAGTSGMSYSWNFGDGNTGSGASVTHTYAATGIYTITLTASSSSASCTYTRTLATWIMHTHLDCDSLQSSFNFSRIGKTVTVNPGYVSWFPGLYSGTTYDYGDGSAPTTATAHSYVNGGTYTIKQRVTWYDSVTSAVTCTDSNTRVVSFYGTIAGYILYDSLTYSGTQDFKVWLIRHDSASGMLTAVDSTTVSHAGFVHYLFTNVVGGRYLVKAARIYSTPSSSGLVPTYHDSSLYWSAASGILNNGYSTSFAQIWMQNGTASTGPGFVGGNVSLGANKGTGSGCKDVTILLRNASGKTIANALTDNSGDFSFTDIPVGDYTIYPELMNYVTIPAAVSVSGASPSVQGITFYQDDVKMNIMSHTLHVTGVNSASLQMSLSPNPAHRVVVLNWSGLSPQTADIQISNATGQLVGRRALEVGSSTGRADLDIRELNAGIYFVRVAGIHSGATMKLVVR